jgi:hypothetical protein
LKKPKTSTQFSNEIQRIFKSFAGNYRQLWLGGIPTQEALSLVADDWQEALARYSAEEIETGRKSWVYNNRMPPTIYEFKELLERLKPKATSSYVSQYDTNADIANGMTRSCIFWRKVSELPNGVIENREQYSQLMNEAEKEEAEYMASVRAQTGHTVSQPKEKRGGESFGETIAKLKQQAEEHLKKANQS